MLSTALIESCPSSRSVACEFLASVRLKPGVLVIEDSAFSRSKRREAVVLPNGLTEINAAHFRGSILMRSVVFPALSVHSGRAAFACTDLTASFRALTIANSSIKVFWRLLSVADKLT